MPTTAVKIKTAEEKATSDTAKTNTPNKPKQSAQTEKLAHQLKIVTIKQVICGRQEDFITQLTATVNILQEDGQDVNVQYTYDKAGIYTALIIGRK